MEDETDLVSPFSGLMRYGKAVDSHDLLKVVATFFMLIDHLGAYILPDDQFLRVLGRVAAPLFFFLIGYAAHHQFKLTIFLCGVLLSALTFFCEKMIFINILINFTIMKYFFERYQFDTWSTRKLIFLFLFLWIIMLPVGSFLEYGTLGMMFAISARLSLKRDPRFLGCLIFSIISYFLEENLGFGFYHRNNMLLSFDVICFGIFILLLRFSPRIWRFPTKIRLLFLIISRYSLWIYTVHVGLLKLLMI